MEQDVKTTTAKTIFVLCHRIPFPADKGDKIRNYNLIKSLASHNQIALGCFIDEPFDKVYQEQLPSLADSVECQPLYFKKRAWNAVIALMRGISITERFYAHSQMAKWAFAQCAKADAIFVASAAMARYVPAEFRHKAVLDFVDYDSQKWLHYANHTANPFKAWLFRREARTLARYEKSLVAEFKAVCLVSGAEAQQFTSDLPKALQHKVIALPNGIDTNYFNPTLFELPIETGCIVFTGEMNYQPNIDAVLWFAKQVLPRIQAHQQVRFCIVGRNPAPEVLALQSDRIEVTGRVDDVRPYLAKAQIVVAPMQLARGVKNKVLEAMAMAKPLVATPAALFGLEAAVHAAIEIADTPERFATACLQLLQTPQQAWTSRQLVEQIFGWQVSANTLTSLLIDANDGPNA